MGILMKSDYMDAASAAQGFPSRDDFWIALSKVCTEADSYLRGHTASVVLFDAEMKDHFYKDLNEVRSILHSLRIKCAPAILDTLADAVARVDAGSLTDGLRVFHAEMDILKANIAKALIPEDEIGVRHKNKPIIMAVDDMPEILEFIMSTLVKHYRVLALSNGHAALKALETQTPDLFLLDIMVPGMSGFQLSETIRGYEKFKKTPIIFITDMSSDKHVLAAVKLGGNDYLRKPLDPLLLLEKVNKHLNLT